MNYTAAKFKLEKLWLGGVFKCARDRIYLSRIERPRPYCETCFKGTEKGGGRGSFP